VQFSRFERDMRLAISSTIGVMFSSSVARAVDIVRGICRCR
jgi:hypothetical protein